MSWLERRSSGCYHVVFRLGNQRFKKSLGTKSNEVAEGRRLRLDENIRLVESGRLAISEGADVATFLLSDGRLNGKPTVARRLTLAALFGGYLEGIPDGSMEDNSLGTVKIHMSHFERILGKGFPVKALKIADLQQYVRTRCGEEGRRKKPVSPTTIRKELATFSAVWTWARVHEYVEGPFPNRGIKYPKTSEKPPFQTHQEIERQLSRGGLAEMEGEELWDCLYLTVREIEEVLALVKCGAGQSFLYPMCVMAAHTGARRSEIVRAQANDFDFEGELVTIREKKRSRSKRTTRTVPLSPLLRPVMAGWLECCPGSRYAFCQNIAAGGSGDGSRQWQPITIDQATDRLKRTLHGTKWEKMRGWHVFRHSFISNCASRGVDQRMIDAWSGHQTDEMRRRYTHLFPDAQHEALRLVFGATSASRK